MKDGQEILVPSDQIRTGDEIVVHMGNVIPFDGVVTAGDAMVNQASLTGESVPVQKNAQKYAYAGTVVEEGELTICVKEVNGGSKFEKIVTMIEESEKLKSNVEGKAEHLADRLVPYTLAGTGLTYHKDTGGTDGRFFLCAETGDADQRTFGDSGSKSV